MRLTRSGVVAGPPGGSRLWLQLLILVVAVGALLVGYWQTGEVLYLGLAVAAGLAIALAIRTARMGPPTRLEK